MTDPTASTEVDALATMPKVEQHLHLEGSIRPATGRGLADRHGLTWEPAEAFTDFDGFLRAFLGGLELLRDASDFATITEALAQELAGQRVMYAEVTTTPYNHHRRGVSMAHYREGLDEGRRRAEALGVAINWILDIPRELEPPDEQFTVAFATGPEAPEGVVALGLGGPEPGWPAARFKSSFDRARAAGLAAIPHAGETEGPASVWSAIRDLGARRIGHGIRSADDPALMAHLAEAAVPLEISLTSNLRTGVVHTIAEHPVRRLTDAGVPVTFNTDDPAYFFTDLTSELLLAQRIGYSLTELATAQTTAMATCLADATASRRFRAEMEAWRQSAGV